MNTNIASLYEFTLQQIAAESYFEGIDLGDSDAVKEKLRLGTNRLGYTVPGSNNSSLNGGYPGYTRMTSVQADEFLSKYKIIHQWSDNPTTGNPRTGAPAGTRSVAEGNPAFDQLNDEILANTGLSATLIQKRDSNGVLTNEYTLAIRSTEFRDWNTGGDGERDKIGADLRGIGAMGFAVAQQEALERYYEWLKVNTDSLGNALLPAGATLNVTGYSLGGNLATVFIEMHLGDADINIGEVVTMNGAGRGQYDPNVGGLRDMVLYYRQILNDPTTAITRELTSNERLQRGNAIAKAGQAFDPKSIYDDARYIWALAETKAAYSLSFNPFTDPNRTGTAADYLITQMFGFESINNTNFTANSGIHGPALAVGIESQPAIEGLAGGFIGSGDFGNGHSISLLADSLALQRAMVKLDPTFDLTKFINLLAAASNRVVVSTVNANYEADVMENVLDSLRRMLLGPQVPKTEFRDGASGFGDITSREGYYANLKELTDSAAFEALAGQLKISAANGNLKNAAHVNFGAFTALYGLSPLAMTSVTTDSVIQTAVGAAWGQILLNWQAARDYSQGVSGSGAFKISDSWLKDRADLLDRKQFYNLNNATYDSTDPKATGKEVLFQQFEDVVWSDRLTGITVRRGGPTAATGFVHRNSTWVHAPSSFLCMDASSTVR